MPTQTEWKKLREINADLKRGGHSFRARMAMPAEVASRTTQSGDRVFLEYATGLHIVLQPVREIRPREDHEEVSEAIPSERDKKA